MHFSKPSKGIFLWLLLLFIFFLSLIPTVLLARESQHILPHPPRFLGELDLSSNQVVDNQTLEGDLMVPLYGNDNQIFYLDVDGKYGNNWKGSMWSFGGGYRVILGDYLLGTYCFLDSNQTTFQSHFNIFNPGLELMTNLWDFHVNGYIPASKRSILKNAFFGQQLGMNDTISFSGHTKYDILFSQFEAVGRGIDGEVGLTLPTRNRVRIFVGGYQFKFKGADSIKGLEIGVEIPVNRVLTIGLKGRESQKQNNAVFLTLRVTLGGKDKSEFPEIQDRIVDPIPRHLATIGNGSGIPARSTIIPKNGQKVPVAQNIWFFTSNSNGSAFSNENGLNNCTFENPCRAEDYNQNNINFINGIASNADFYFTPGYYPLINNLNVEKLSGPGVSQITLNEGQSIYGRTHDYTQPAQDNERPVFGGSLKLTGNNIVSNIKLQGKNTQENIGIMANGANNLILHQVEVREYRGADGVLPNEPGEDAVGISIINSNNVKLAHVSVSDIRGGIGSSGPDTNGQATGIDLTNGMSVYVENAIFEDIYGNINKERFGVQEEYFNQNTMVEWGNLLNNFNFTIAHKNNFMDFLPGVKARTPYSYHIKPPIHPNRVLMHQEVPVENIN